MNNIIESLLEQRKRLVHELCDIEFSETNASEKVGILQTEIDKIDELIKKFSA